MSQAAIADDRYRGDAIEFDELHARVDAGDTSCVLVNVLSRASFEMGRIPGSVNLPLPEVAERAGEVLPAIDQETVVYCASAACMLARQATVLLRQSGYTSVREYHGGMEEWTERLGRIERAAITVRAVPAAAPRSRLRKLLAALSPSAAFEWASSQTLPILFALWMSSSLLFALVYWAAGNTDAALTSGGTRLSHDLASLIAAFGFSVATAMSSSFGEVTASGWTRVIVLVETAANLILVSALISSILDGQQQKVLAEVHRLACENRLARLRTNLHFLLVELAEIAGQCANLTVPRHRIKARIESVSAIFAGELEAVRDFLFGDHDADDDRALDGIFASLAAGLEDLNDLMSCLPDGRERSPALRRSLRSIAGRGGDLCSTCIVGGTRSLAMTQNMDRVHRACRALSDDLRPGDRAPAFTLAGSDGATHRLEQHRGRPVVLLWFPKAFTGG